MKDYEVNLSMMKKCRLYIDENLDKNHLLKGPALAKHFKYSYTNFRRIFIAIGGYDVLEYIQMRKVQKAAMCLRKGEDLSAAMLSSGYESKNGLRRAFVSIYGMTPSEFAKSRGQALMKEPEIVMQEGFTVVGYRLPGPEAVVPENNGAFWIAQDFPDVSPREYGRIGGGDEMIGVWAKDNGKNVYVFGPGVTKVRYVPEGMMACAVPGGAFAVFRVEKPPDRPLPPNEPGPYGTYTVPDNSLLCENFRVTWYYGLHQWLPDSDWFYDKERLPYEYCLNEDQLIYIPIKPKIEY